jgi:hypothetical protein
VRKARATAAAVVGLALSATAAFAAHPNPGTTHVAQVTTEDPSESAEPSESPEQSESPEASESPDGDQAGSAGAGAQGEHGAAVSAVAQDETAVGGKNDNHGGAVSAVARGDHGPGADASSKAPKTHGKSGQHGH